MDIPGQAAALSPTGQSLRREASCPGARPSHGLRAGLSTIPVEKIRGSVQLVSGGDDQMWPSAELADIAFHRLQANKHPYPFYHLNFAKAGHQILIPHGPRTVLVSAMAVEGFDGYLYSQGGTAKDNAEAGTEAWHDLLGFLDKARENRN